MYLITFWEYVCFENSVPFSIFNMKTIEIEQTFAIKDFPIHTSPHFCLFIFTTQNDRRFEVSKVNNLFSKRFPINVLDLIFHHWTASPNNKREKIDNKMFELVKVKLSIAFKISSSLRFYGILFHTDSEFLSLTFGINSNSVSMFYLLR